MKLAGNKEGMKQENRRQILYLISRRPISRAELARETGLTQSAVGNIMNELLAENIVMEAGKQDDAAFGRKPIAITLNPSWGAVVCISIDHEGFEVGLTDLSGRISGQKISLPCGDPEPDVLDEIAAAAETLIRQAQVSNVIGVGVIVPGPVDGEAGRILNPPGFPSWHNFSVREELERRLPYRVFVKHNAHALAKAEARFGAGIKYGSFALLMINSGIGLGLMLNHQIYTGAGGLGCEIGHTSVDINGRPCVCGSRGCLELYSSTSAVLYDAQRQRPDITDWKDFVDKAWDGDSFCENLMDDQTRYLAHSIINLNNLLELDAVVIAGLGAYRGELLMGKMKNYVEKCVLSKGTRNLCFEKSSLAENALISAASTVVTDRLFEGDLYSIITGHPQ